MKIIFLIINLAISLTAPVLAQAQLENEKPIIQLFSIDYLDGIHNDRSIRSYHINLTYGKYINNNVALFGQLILAKNTGHSISWHTGALTSKMPIAMVLG